MRESTLRDYQRRMLRVLRFIQENLDRELGLGELAGVAFFSPYHFHRVFHGMVGETLGAHIRRIRLERAAWGLRESGRSVIDIAFEAGYESHEAFTRAFGALFGESPSAFRAGHGRPLAVAPSGVHFGALLPDDFHPYLTGGTTMDAKIRELEATRVAFVRHTGPYAECERAWGVLCANLGPKGLLGPKTKFIGLSYDDPDVTPADKIRYDACATVGDDFEADGDVGTKTILAGEYAVTVHRGPYVELSKTYAALCGQWIPRAGRAIRSEPSMEIYLDDPKQTAPAELRTEVWVPLEAG